MLLETLLCVPWDGMLMHERVKFAIDLILITNPIDPRMPNDTLVLDTSPIDGTLMRHSTISTQVSILG